MNDIMLQMLSNFVILMLAFVIVAMFQKGFFWPYARVKMSFGKFVLVKVKEINRDLYRVGKIVESDLIYKLTKSEKRLALDKTKPQIYKSIGVSMVDVDAEKNTILNPVGYDVATGYDAEKIENLYVRALTKPQIVDNKEKILLLLVVVSVGICAFIAYMMVMQGEEIIIIKNTVSNLNKGLITAGGGI